VCVCVYGVCVCVPSHLTPCPQPPIRRETTATLGEGGVPTMQSVVPWDGKDGQVPEEMPLGDLFAED
jgi:hypothetical protein